MLTNDPDVNELLRENNRKWLKACEQAARHAWLSGFEACAIMIVVLVELIVIVESFW